MRSRSTLSRAAAIAALLAGCAPASSRDDDRPGIPATGSGGTRSFAVRDFSRVGLGAAGDVDIRTGRDFGVSVTGDPAALDMLRLRKNGETIDLGLRNGTHPSFPGRIRWTITMPRLAEADIGGAGTITVDRVEGGDFGGNIGGSGTLTVAALAVDKATFAIGGSGTIVAAGTARALKMTVGGSGNLRGERLAAQSASITIAGAGNVAATVHGHADVNIVGSGDVTLTGGAQCKVTKMGGGDVRCS